MKIGKRFGSDELSIVDDGTLEGEAGYNKYDSEGTPSQKTYLIKDGILTNRLHSRETAANMNESPTGNARAISYASEPIVRMTNTYMESRNQMFEEMLAGVDEGIYAKGSLGGQTNTEMFTFSAEEAYKIKGGKVCEKIRDEISLGSNSVIKGDILFKSHLKTEEGAEIDGYIKGSKSKKNVRGEEDEDIEKITAKPEFGKPTLVKVDKEEAV